MSTEKVYCKSTSSFWKIDVYFDENISGYVNIPICFVGIIFNLFNLFVFTRKHMISPVNLIFAHLALADLLISLGSVPIIWLMFFQYISDVDERWTYIQAAFFVRCEDFIFTFHFVSVFLTVTLAIWRYIAVIYPLKERQWCNMKITRGVLIAGYIMSIFLSIPAYLSSEIQSISADQTISRYQPTLKKNSILPSVSFVILGLLHQLLPSVLLLAFMSRLIIFLLKKKQHQGQSIPSSSNQNTCNIVRSLKMKQRTDRSISILLTVLTLFLTAKVPLGILNSIIMIYNRPDVITLYCYSSVATIFNTLTNINISITFLVYYTMSENFRITFKSLLSRNSVHLQNDIVVVAPDSTKKMDEI